MLRWFLIFLLALLPLLGDGYEEEEYEGHLPRDLSFLELTPRQQEALGELLNQNLRQLHQLHEEREALTRRLKALFLEQNFDRRSFEEALLESKRKEAQIQTELFARIHDLLTPRQRRHFIRYMKEWEIE